MLGCKEWSGPSCSVSPFPLASLFRLTPFWKVCTRPVRPSFYSLIHTTAILRGHRVQRQRTQGTCPWEARGRWEGQAHEKRNDPEVLIFLPLTGQCHFNAQATINWTLSLQGFWKPGLFQSSLSQGSRRILTYSTDSHGCYLSPLSAPLDPQARETCPPQVLVSHSNLSNEGLLPETATLSSLLCTLSLRDSIHSHCSKVSFICQWICKSTSPPLTSVSSSRLSSPIAILSASLGGQIGNWNNWAQTSSWFPALLFLPQLAPLQVPPFQGGCFSA